MLNYDYSNVNAIVVKLGKTKCGVIKKVECGWQYYPANKKCGGEIFAKIEDCQKSLEYE